MLVSGVLLSIDGVGQAALLGGVLPARWSLGAGQVAGMWAVPNVLTPLTATLIHASWAHLVMNGVTLFYTGLFAERALGRGGLIALYLTGAYGAAVAQWAAGPHAMAPMIGASGAISATLAAYALLYAQQLPRPIGPIPARAVQVGGLLLTWVGVNFLLGIAGRQAGMPIATAAHVGGFIVGLALARPLLRWRWRHA